MNMGNKFRDSWEKNNDNKKCLTISLKIFEFWNFTLGMENFQTLLRNAKIKIVRKFLPWLVWFCSSLVYLCFLGLVEFSDLPATISLKYQTISTIIKEISGTNSSRELFIFLINLFWLSVFLTICLFDYLSFWLSVFLTIYLSDYLSFW